MTEPPLLLTSRQAAELVGVTESTWHRWVRQGRVPRSLIHPLTYGGRRRFSRVKLERWAAGEAPEGSDRPLTLGDVGYVAVNLQEGPLPT